MRALAIVLVCLVSSTSYGQRLSSGGSAAQFRDLAEMKANWQNSKKLSAIGTAPTSEEMPPQVHNPDNLSEKQIGDLAYWQFYVSSIVDEKNMLLRLGPSIYWLTDYPTKGLVDDDLVRLIGPVMCVGSKKYTSVLGATSTVKAFRLVSQDEIDKQAKELADAEEARLWGTWHSKAGTKVYAKFVSWKSGKVELLTKDGRKLVVDISAFTAEDAAELRRLNLEARSKKK